MKPGDVIAERFVLEALAGSGGMGAVFRAHDRLTGEPIAVKALHDPGGGHVERFLREAQVLAELDHPHIVRYVDHGRSERGELYMAMEWVDGRSLADDASHPPFTLAESVTLVSRIAAALAFAHARGIVHRDIKPSNLLLLRGTLEPKLVDFGIARLAQAARLTGQGMMLGTPGFMAPEQARGAGTLTARADVFSLGCVLFKCLAGQPPFPGDDVREVIGRVLFEPAPTVGSLRPGIPPELEALVARMLAKDPAERPADGAAVVEALRKLAPGIPGAVVAELLQPQRIGRSEQAWIGVVLARSAAPDPMRATVQEVPIARLAGTQARKGTVPALPLRATALELPALSDATSPPHRDELGTLVESAAGAPPALAQALLPLGVALEALADGSLLATVHGEADPAALAVRAVRVAQRLHALRPALRLGVITGLAQRSAHPGVGPALEQAAAWLDRLHEADARHALQLDAPTAALVEARFQLGREGARAWVEGERDPLTPPVGPCLGREPELDKLCALAQRALGEHRPTWVAVVGAPGSGKTRLAQAFHLALGARHPGLRTWWVAADPSEGEAPLSLALRLIRAALAGSPSVAVARRAQGLLEGLSRPEPPLAFLAAPLAALLQAATAEGPLLLLLDDLDRADALSTSLLALALESAAPAPMVALVLGTEALSGRLAAAAISAPGVRLEGLNPAACAAWVRQAWGPDASDERVALTARLARGNPWILQALIASGPEREPGVFPEAVLARVAGQLEALPAELRRVLRAATPWERPFTRGDLALVLGAEVADRALDHALDHLVQAGWLERRGEAEAWGEAHFTVRDPLVGAASRALLTAADQRIAHGLVASRLEQRAEVDLTRIARHWVEGGQPSRAAECYLRAAQQARASEDLALVVEQVERGLPLAAEGVARRELLSLFCEAQLWRGALATAEAAARSALDGLPPSSPEAARGVSLLAAAAGQRCDGAVLLELAHLLEAQEVWSAQAMVAAARVVEHLVEGGHASATLGLQRRIHAQIAAGSLDAPVRAALLHLDGALAQLRCRPDAAYRAFQQSAALQAELGEGWAHCEAQLRMTLALEVQASAQASSATFAGLRARAERAGLPSIQCQAALGLARVLASVGRSAEVEPLLSEAAALAEPQGRLLGEVQLARAEHLVAGGALDDAEAPLRAALALLEPLPARHVLASARLAALLTRRNQPGAALALARDTVTRLEALSGVGAQVEVPVRHLAAEIFLTLGLRDRGRHELERARDGLLAQAAAMESAEGSGAWLAHPAHARVLESARLWLGEPDG